MLAPEKIWWKPLGRMEKTWLTVAFVWCVFLTLMMPLWYFMGKQNVPTETYRTTPAQFNEKVQAFTEQYKIGEDTINGVTLPVVEAPPGSDVYLRASTWQWFPILQFRKGETYRLHISSMDLQHGFSLQPVNINLQILPQYDYVATIVPTSTGEFTIVCNEFCSLGHHTMIGKIIVKEK
ncbi:MAG: cytochrome C oxidase subunit II [Anaerolineales bacterium]|nr:cytochrome C oxidase subunit II [Anaerolineales bacterium]